MYSDKSYLLKKEEYNYLLPVLRKKINNNNDRYYFTGNYEDLYDMLDRLKGLYNYYDELKSFVVYKCSKNGSLIDFRRLFINK